MGNARKLRVAIDGHMIGTRETGNETYIVQLSAALAKLGGYDYKLYTSHPSVLLEELGRAEAPPVEPLPPLPSLVRIPLYYPFIAASTDAALLHMTYVAPPIAPCPVVLSVHDVSYRIFPQFFSPRVLFILGLLVGPSVRRAARVITLSESARRDIIRFYHVHPRRVVVTPAAAGPQYVPQSQDEVERLRRAMDLPERYVLAVGNVQPRKNLPRLVEAFSQVAAQFADMQLVIAGRSAWGGSDVSAAVKRLGLADRVRFVGYVPDADLPALYSGATVFCYPSLYEGFGLPPLEAMACGVPTITSNAASLPEVVGDAALTVDPTSVRDISESLARLLGDEQLRQDCSARGLMRASLFSWELTARLTRDVYDSVLQTSRRVESSK